MDNLMVQLVARLISIQCEMGQEAYQRAAYAAYRALGRFVLDEAEREAGVAKVGPSSGNVVKFPLGARLDRTNGGL